MEDEESNSREEMIGGSSGEEGMCRFFVVGDIGQEGRGREAVGEAMAGLQASWKAAGEAGVGFVVSTGDNVYGRADESAFCRLREDLLDRVPVPWLVALGNHDVSEAKLRWHLSRHGLTGGPEGGGGGRWRWVCPAPAYDASEELAIAYDCDQRGKDGEEERLSERKIEGLGLVQLLVINTNMLIGPMRRSSMGPAPGFYVSRSAKWWTEQKHTLRDRLAETPPGVWRLVVGHHPCEFVPVSWLEHRTPLVRFYAATFMKGGVKCRRSRSGLAHVIGRQADLYLCGHQHLQAGLRLDPGSGAVPADECRCAYTIVGASSHLDAPSAPIPPSPTSLYSDAQPPSQRYSSSYVAPSLNGFVVVEVISASITIRHFVVTPSGSVELHRQYITKKDSTLAFSSSDVSCSSSSNFGQSSSSIDQ